MWERLTTRHEGEWVRLEPIEPRHEDGLFAALDHDEVWTWLPRTHPDRAEFADFFGFLLGENAAGNYGTFITIDQASDTVLGTSSYLALRPEHRGLEIGFTMLGPGAWGTGANIEAKLLMMDHAFGALGCHRVEFKTDARNERSRGALAALPAQFEGIFRKHMTVPDGMRDSAYFSVIDEEWPEVRANLEARLAVART